MKRILILANHFNTLRIFRRELIKALVADGLEVFVSIPECDEGNRDLLESYGCKVFFTQMDRRGKNPVEDLLLIREYYRLVKQIQPDKVLTYTVKPNIYGALVCKWLRVPCIVNITGLGSAFQGMSPTRLLVSLMYKFSINKAEKILFENVGNRDTLVHDHIVDVSRTAVLAGAGVNLDEFQETPYPTEEKPLYFLFVGRIMKEKGVDELFRAIPHVKKHYPDTVFDFIGWYEDDYEAIVRDLQQKEYIRFFGFQDDVKPFIEKAHCIIHPSYHEGMSNTLLEGAAMCRPLITSDIHGCMEAVEDGQTGYLARVKSAKDLYRKIMRFAALPYEEKRQMGIRGRQRMKSVFDKQIVVKKTLEYIYK